MKERIQRFGGFVAGMVIPNLGAFIAWGFITALLIPTGWLAKTSLDWDWELLTGNIVEDCEEISALAMPRSSVGGLSKADLRRRKTPPTSENRTEIPARQSY